MEGHHGTGPRRRRPPACDPCRKRKLRCDRNVPCSMCLRSRREECLYTQAPQISVAAASLRSYSRTAEVAEAGSSQVPALVPPPPSLEATQPEFSNETSGDQDSPDVNLESSLATGAWHTSTLGSIYISGQTQNSSSVGQPSAWGNSAMVSRPGRRQAANDEEGSEKGREPDQWIIALRGVTSPIKGIMFKGRYVGQSHWLQTQMLIPTALRWVHQGPSRKGTEMSRLLQECKVLSQQIKRKREPTSWNGQCGQHFPPRIISDQLLNLYIQNFESVYRILHIPTLLSEYERRWLNPATTDTFTVLKIQLCLALGSYLYDDIFSLRVTVVQWIYEAKMAFILVRKPPPGLIGMQLLCLLHLVCRFYEGKHGPPAWISGGTVYQAAISVGLHIDPSKLPKVNPCEVETRRRLWATVLELQLEASLDAGMVPLMSLEDSDCEAPSNLDDAQLDSELDAAPAAHPASTFTSTSLQIAFSHSVDLRLKIAKLVNNTRYEATYGEVLRLTSDLEDANRILTNTMASYGTSVSKFHKHWCEMLIRRYFLVLHTPYMQLAMDNPLYYFSRKVCVDNAVKLSYNHGSHLDGDSTLEAFRTVAKISHVNDEFLHFIYCTNGQSRVTQMMCSGILAAELLALVQEGGPDIAQGQYEEQLPSGSGCNVQIAQLHALLRQELRYVVRRIKAGNTNAKEYSSVAVLLAEIEAAMTGSPPDALMDARAMEAFKHSAAMLQEQVSGQLSMDDMTMEPPETEFDASTLGPLGNFWLDEMLELG